MKQKILLVDDDPDMRNMLNFRLSHSGFDVKPAACGQEAYDFALSFLPHLVILDYSLPDFSGNEVIKKYRMHPLLKTLPVIFYSATLELAELPTGPYITALCKPAPFENVLTAINAVLNK